MDICFAFQFLCERVSGIFEQKVRDLVPDS